MNYADERVVRNIHSSFKVWVHLLTNHKIFLWRLVKLFTPCIYINYMHSQGGCTFLVSHIPIFSEDGYYQRVTFPILVRHILTGIVMRLAGNRDMPHRECTSSPGMHIVYSGYALATALYRICIVFLLIFTGSLAFC